MFFTVCLTLLWPAISYCQDFVFRNGDGFIVTLGDSTKTSSGASSAPPLPPWVSTSEAMFFVSRQTNATRVVATIASGIRAEADLPYSITDPSGANGDQGSSGPSFRHAVLLDGSITLTSHVVTNNVGSTGFDDGGQPSIDVLLHADGLPLPGSSCFRVLASRNGRDRVTASCFLVSPDASHRDAGAPRAAAAACLARLPVPLDWTIGGGAIDIRFAPSTADGDACSRAANSAKPSVEEDAAGGSWYLAGRVQLVGEGAGGGATGIGYKEVQEDQHVLLGVPDMAMRPGSTFTIPVKLQAESDLQVFVMKIRTGKDLRLLDAKTADASTWSVSFNQEERGGSVTAMVRSSETYTKMPKVQDVFYCQFEVLQTAQSGTDARITWMVEYESSYTDMNFVSIERKVITTRLKIGSDQTKHIVVVTKNNDIFNTRLFHDQTLFVPLWIYSVSYTGAVKAITASDGALCTSRNPKVLQVTKKCDGVYVPLGEIGCGMANVDVQFSQRSRIVTFRVWCLDDRLVLKLSDEKLNEVREWRVPAYDNATDSQDHASNRLICMPRYQTTDVRVFTRFYVLDREGHSTYYRGGGKTVVLTDVTSMVKPFIKVADGNIATYKNGYVTGVAKGKTEVQVILTNGRMLAVKDLQVTRTKESIERFAVNVISSASLTISRRADVSGVLMANLNLEEKLDAKHQEAVLDIWIKFTDGTFVALRQFDPKEYTLVVESQNPSVVRVLPTVVPHQPRVQAVGSGKAMVKVALHASDECQQRHTGVGGAVRPLAVQFAYVLVDNTSPEDVAVQQQSGFADVDSEPSGDLDGRRHGSSSGSKKAAKETAYQNDAAPEHDGGFFSQHKPASGRLAQGMLADNGLDVPGGAAGTGAQRVSPLDVGMYVVAGVLGVIVAVLAANCIVYARRQRKSQEAGPGGAEVAPAVPVGGAAPVKQSSGWVWIGRGTLEKHAVSTSCGEFMPEPDFARRYSQCAPQSALTASSSRTSSVRRSSSCTGGGSTYRGSECSVRITVSSREDDCPEGSHSDCATTEALDGSDVDDDRPVITPDDADSCGSEPLLAGLSQAPYSYIAPARGSRSSSSCDALARESLAVGCDNVSVRVMPLIVGDVALTQAEFDNLKESTA